MAAEDRQDLDATLATFTDDCYYRVPGLGIELRGKDEIRRWYEDLFAAIPDFRNSDERYWEAEGQVFFARLHEGTHLGTWHGWAPTGRSVQEPDARPDPDRAGRADGGRDRLQRLGRRLHAARHPAPAGQHAGARLLQALHRGCDGRLPRLR